MSPDGSTALKASANACLACRRVKMKCTMTIDPVKCDRCVRKSIDCAFREHRRGRKPGTRLIKASSKRSLNSHMQDAIPERPVEGQPAQPVQPPLATQPSSRDERVSDFWAESEGLQPDGLLSHQAMKGKFSLQNILSTNHGSAFDRPVNSVSVDDPIRCGLVTYERAVSLFESFMTKLNPYISQLDPYLHSLTYVRQKSSFLFSAVLTAATKSFEPTLYPTMLAHAEKLFMEAFRRGDKSAETVQAIMVLTYWKEPNDTRAWMSVGLAIRMSMDLGWHKLGTTPDASKAATDTQQREIRNAERTWLVLFVYDRSMSLQTGKPWMIERSPFIESVQSWWTHPQAIENDRLLCSFVTLRLLAAEVFDLLNPGSQYAAPRPLSMLQTRIERWQAKWLEVTDAVSCHSFLIRFYGAHQSLQLFSIPLQETLKKTTFDETCDLKPFWVSYQSAMTMLRLMPEYSSFLRLCQDSIHVMTAYSAVLLIKLLLSSPPPISQEIESDTLAAIRAAATVLTAQSSSSSTSCSLQSKFLNNILSEYSAIRRPRPLTIPSARPIDRPSAPSSTATSFPDSPATVQSQSPAGHVDTHPGSARSFPSTANPEPFASAQNPTPPSSVHPPYFHRPSHPYDPSMPPIQPTPNMPPTSGMGFSNQIDEASNFLFSDDATWVGMFASAGFSIQDGVFCGQST